MACQRRHRRQQSRPGCGSVVVVVPGPPHIAHCCRHGLLDAAQVTIKKGFKLDLVRTFILRRTKEEVLEELPSITEITLDVELSDEERAFYEALGYLPDGK